MLNKKSEKLRVMSDELKKQELRKTNFYNFLCFICCLLFTVHFSLFTVAHADVIDDIQKNQKNINTVKANFYQEKHTEILEKPIISKGIFYYRAPYNVRWEYKENNSLIVIYDGKTLYLYYPDIKEADKLDSPLQLSSLINFDISSLKKDYDIKQRADRTGHNLIILTPKLNTPISSIEMLFTGDMIFPQEVKITEKTGDRALIKFSDITINKNLSEDLFRFVPETGVKIRERSLR